MFLFVGCSVYSRNDIKHYEYMKEGAYSKVTIPPVKDFVSKGLIFVESKVTIDVNGERTGSEITNEMLMREADKVGADDVINVKIDEIQDHKVINKYDENGNFTGREYKQKNYIYKASGLAIKYTNVIDNGLGQATLNNSTLNYYQSVPSQHSQHLAQANLNATLPGPRQSDEKASKIKNYNYSKWDILAKIGVGFSGESKVEDASEKNNGQVSFEVDGIYWFDKVGLGAGVSLDMLQSYKIQRYYYYDEPFYDGKKESQMFFNVYGILALRKNNYYLYANLGTKIGAGVGINISNFIIDVSYNKYFDRELDYGFKLKADKATLSIGYKFSVR